MNINLRPFYRIDNIIKRRGNLYTSSLIAAENNA